MPTEPLQYDDSIKHRVGPVIYEKLLTLASDHLQPLIEERLINTARNNANAIVDLFAVVYKQGLLDGFQQGVQAVVDDLEKKRTL